MRNNLPPDHSVKDTRRQEEFSFKTVIDSMLGAFSLQHGILPTMRDLLLRPKQVLEAYFLGDKRYLGPGPWLSFCLTVVGLCNWLGGKWVIKNLLEKEEFERLVKKTGDREFIEQIETNQIAMFELFFNNPGMMFAANLLPFVVSFKLMFRRSGQNLAQHFIIQMYCLGLILVFTSLPNLLWMGQEFRIENMADSASRGFPEIVPRGSYLLYTYSSLFFMLGYYSWASRSIFEGKTFPIILRTLVAIVLGLLFTYWAMEVTATILAI